ncbi:MAG: hypothetical protein E7451_03430 [Ruminococcaceae bacterium]|nr:hypothetical protein [Oscillospiraceae bacterium]
MKQLEQLTAKVNELREKAKPVLEKADKGYRKAKEIWAVAWPWIWQFRKILFAIPVVYLALYFARLNWNVLPEQVGLNLQTSGEYAQYISRELAVYGPLGVTGGCLAMMFLSRKTVYPWMICMFSMLLPLLILVTNIFPA